MTEKQKALAMYTTITLSLIALMVLTIQSGFHIQQLDLNKAKLGPAAEMAIPEKCERVLSAGFTEDGLTRGLYLACESEGKVLIYKTPSNR